MQDRNSLVIITYAMVALLLGVTTVFSQNYVAKFSGTPKVELLRDREIRLLENFSFFDAHGIEWQVKKGFVSDGASIPQAFFSITGGPLSGKFRNAAIIHDYFCARRAHRWNLVHKIFYEASVAGGVNEGLAWAMYQVVFHLGPRWENTIEIPESCLTGTGNLELCVLNAESPKFPTLTHETKQKIVDGISKKGFSEIAIKVDRSLSKLLTDE